MNTNKVLVESATLMGDFSSGRQDFIMPPIAFNGFKSDMTRSDRWQD